MAEGTRLLSEYGVYSSIAGSNPALSVSQRPARVNVTCVTPLGDEVAWIS